MALFLWIHHTWNYPANNKSKNLLWCVLEEIMTFFWATNEMKIISKLSDDLKDIICNIRFERAYFYPIRKLQSK